MCQHFLTFFAEKHRVPPEHKGSLETSNTEEERLIGSLENETFNDRINMITRAKDHVQHVT